ELARFRIEVEALARLQHPHIVPIYEVGDYQDRPFFAMEYVSGGTLKDWLKDGLPTPRNAARLAEMLARAVHHAHQRGVLHRDLQPENVLLQRTNHDTDAKNEGEQKTADERGNAVTPPTAPSPRTALPGPSCVAWSGCTPRITDFGLAKFLDAEAE